MRSPGWSIAMPSRWIGYLNLRLALHIQLTTPAHKEHTVGCRDRSPGLLREPRPTRCPGLRGTPAYRLADADGLDHLVVQAKDQQGGRPHPDEPAFAGTAVELERKR